jgi:hypothetical protein
VALKAGNGDGAAEATLFPRPVAGKDDGAFESAKGLFGAIDGCWGFASLLNIVDWVLVFATGFSVSRLAFGNMDVGPKGLAPGNTEDAKGFLDSGNVAGGELMGLKRVEGAVVTGAGVSVF